MKEQGKKNAFTMVQIHKLPHFHANSFYVWFLFKTGGLFKYEEPSFRRNRIHRYLADEKRGKQQPVFPTAHILVSQWATHDC